MSLLIETVSDSTKARKDLDALKKSVGGIETSVKTVTEGFQKMALQIGVAAAAFGTTKAFLEMSDTMTNLENKIKAVSQSTNDYKKALQGIKDLAISTRSDLSATASLYQRIAVNQKELGIGTKTTLRVVEIVNKALKVGGASAAEATAAMVQFGQALGSGNLAGDELKSLAESAPTLLKGLADGLDVPIGRLKKMGEEGKLLSSVILPALLKAGEKIDKDFGGMKVTFGDAFKNLSTGFILLKDSISKYFFGSKNTLANWLNEVAISAADVAKYFSYYMAIARSKVAYFVVSSVYLVQKLFPEISEMASKVATVVSNLMKGITPDFTRGLDGIKEWIGKMSSIIVDGFAILSQKASSWLDASPMVSAWLSGMMVALGGAYVKIESAISSWRIDVSKFFVSFEPVKKMVLEWVHTLERAFFWLYDRVIGNSWIPDLVIGVGIWLKKLLLSPLTAVKFFAKSVSGIFKGLLGILTLGAFNKGLGSMILRLGIVAGLFALIFKAYDPTAMSKFLEKVSNKKFSADTSIVEKATSGLKGFAEKFKETLNDNFFSRTLRQVFDLKDKAKSSLGDSLSSVKVPDGVKEMIPTLRGAFQSIPEVLQAPLAIGISLAFAKALSSLSSNNLVSKSLAILGGTMAAGFFLKVMNPSIFSDTIYGIATKFLQILAKGFDVLLGGNAFANPLGLISLLAKFALLFAAGRKFLGGVAGKLAQAPSNVGRTLGTRLESSYAERNVKGIEKKLTQLPQSLQKAVSDARNERRQRLSDFARQSGQNTATAFSNIQNPNYTAANPQLAKLLADARNSSTAFSTARDNLANISNVTNGVKNQLNDAKVEAGKLKLQLLERKEKSQESFKNTASGLGGVIGGVGGLQIGAEILKVIPNAPEWVKVATVLASGFVGQVLGSALGNTLAAGIILAMEKGGSAVSKLWTASPWWLQLVVGIGAALYLGYQLFTSLPKGWSDQIKASFGLGGKDGSEQLTKTELAGIGGAVSAASLVLFNLTTILTAVSRYFTPSQFPSLTGNLSLGARVAAFFTAIGGSLMAKVSGITSGLVSSFSNFLGRIISPNTIRNISNLVSASPIKWLKPLLVGLFAALALGAAKADEAKGTGTTIKPERPNIVNGMVLDKLGIPLRQATQADLDFGKRTSADPRRTDAEPAVRAAYLKDLKEAQLAQGDISTKLVSWLDTLEASNPMAKKFIETLKGMAISMSAKGEVLKETLANGPEGIISGSSGSSSSGVNLSNLGPEELAGAISSSLSSTKELSVPAADVLSAIEGDKSLQGRFVSLADEINKWVQIRDGSTSGSWTQNQAMENIGRLTRTASDMIVQGNFSEDVKAKNAGKGSESSESLKGVGYAEVFKIVSETFPKLGLIAEEFKSFGDKQQFTLFEQAAELYDKTAKINSELVGLRNKAKTGKNADGKVITDKAIFGLNEDTFNGLNARLQAVEAERIAVQDKLIDSLLPKRNNTQNVGLASQLSGTSIDPKAAQQFSKDMVSVLLSTSLDLDSARAARDKLKTGDDGAEEANDRVKKAQRVFDDTLDKAMTSITDPGKFAYIGSQLGVGIEEATYNMLNAAQKAAISTAFSVAREARAEIAAASTDEARRSAQLKLTGASTDAASIVARAVADPAKDAGKAYASGIKSSFETGIRGIFEGKENGKGVLMAALDTFANGVMNSVFDTVAKSFTERIFSPDKIMKSFESDGSSLFDLFSGGGKKEGGSSESGTDSPTGILSGIWGAITSFVSPLLAFFGFSQAASAVETSTAIADSVSLSLIAANTSVMAAMAGSETAGSIIGLLAATGGYVSGPGTGTSDSIPAMLSNGEFVTNARATKKFAPLLHAINSGKIGKYAAGGIVGAPIMASITPAGNSGGSSQSVFNINITGDVSRQTRAEIQRMIPNIATGVGMYNRELGTR